MVSFSEICYIYRWNTCMNFRIAHPSDAPILAAISIEVWLGTYIRRGVNALFAEYALNEFTADKFAMLLSDPNEHVIVSENEDGLDGYIRMSHERPAPVSNCSMMEISTLYVQPRHHGKRLGKLLLEQGLNYARENNSPSVWLTTNSENTPAIAFYLKNGFEKVGTTHFRIEDKVYLNDVYRYNIAK
jgi:ribosomal protein S18 acetylase RimI-like enzyme